MNKISKLLTALLLAVAVAIPTVNAQEKFKRDLEQVSFVPKGQWIQVLVLVML